MPPDFSREVHGLLGLPFDAVDIDRAKAVLCRSVDRRAPCFLSTPNLNFLIACQADPAFRQSVLISDLSVADGTPIVWLARLLGIPIRERVAGSDVFERLRGASAPPLRVYFFGGPDGVAEAASQALNRSPSGLTCVGFHSPGFGSVAEMSSGDIIANINASQADFVVVSLGAKKGQAWITRNREHLDAPLISHLGAVVNFVAGSVTRAPRALQRGGLEWLWRIKEEPALWRRYWGDGIALLRLLATRVLPLIVSRRSPARSGGNAESITVVVEQRDDLTLIKLAGALTGSALGSLRSAYAGAASAGKNVQLDLSAVSAIDSAFLGLTMLLYGYLTERGLSLKLHSPSSSVRRMFKYSCADYLLAARG